MAISPKYVLSIAFTVSSVATAQSEQTISVPPNNNKDTSGSYIVQMRELPTVAYKGTIHGLKSTRPQQGQKLNLQSKEVQQYAAYLDKQHDTIVQRIGADKIYDYRHTFNGFAAHLTAKQVAQLKADPNVVAVTKDEIFQPTTVTTPTFLGLNQTGGIWSVLSGNEDGNPVVLNGIDSYGAGEGVVIGIIDSGIWPENPSFSDKGANGEPLFSPLPNWHGACVEGDQFSAANCNQKLIGARWFNRGFGGDSGIKRQFPYEFLSARDANGHGTHTGGTAGGNYGVNAVIGGQSYGKISGMAPRARIATYKSCWGKGTEGGCKTSDSVAAIDRAVADGVDVINYSISGTSSDFFHPVEIAFLFAADAGVFVATSAGNAGPEASTVNHPSPWLMTVAASTHDRYSEGAVTLGNGLSYKGVSLGSAIGPVPIILSNQAGLPGADPNKLALCYGAADNATVLDPVKVAGKIVVCDRGTTARINKSSAVQQAGGVGMVLVNTSPNSLNADIHVIPTVHLPHTDRDAIRAYASTDGATASIEQSVFVQQTAPSMATFSSRGPSLGDGGSILKPDITAPGVDVLASVAPPGHEGKDFNFASGTSMSSPHIAGIAALMKQLHPDWSPAAIKSALMTTAYQTTKTGEIGLPFGKAFDFGAGHVDPNKAMNPGLVLDTDFTDYIAFLCGVHPTVDCASPGTGPIEPSQLNIPSIAIKDLVTEKTVIRTVKNVSGEVVTFTGNAHGLEGITTRMEPAQFTLKPNEQQAIRITFLRNRESENSYVEGDVTWTSDKGYQVRIPTVARMLRFGAPQSVSGTGVPLSYSVQFGYSGSFGVVPKGVVPPITNNGVLTQKNKQVRIPITLSEGTRYARFALFDEDATRGSDLDLSVIYNGAVIGESYSETATEEINLSYPLPGQYTIVVDGYDLPSGSSPFKLYHWPISDETSTNMKARGPKEVSLGMSREVELYFKKLVSATRYLGLVDYRGVPGDVKPTIVSITTP